MRPTKVKPAPSVSTNEFEQNASSPRGSVVLDPSFPFPDPGGSNVAGPSSARDPPFPDPSSLSGPPFPDPSAPRDPPFPDPSSLSGPPFPDPSAPRDPPFPDPSSLSGPLFPDPSVPRGPPFLDPSSPSDPALPDPSAPKGSLFPDPSSPRCSVASDSLSSRSFLSPETSSPKRSKSLSMRRSSESLGHMFLNASLQQMPMKEKGPNLKFRVPIPKAKGHWNDDDTPHWLCATIALLLICILLLVMVSLMSVRESALNTKSKEMIDIALLKVLLLSETLKDLQMGKARTCSMCRTQWAQHRDLCFWFSDLGLSWQSSKNFCREESSTLAVMETKAEMEFLRHESTRYFIMYQDKALYDLFWVGLEYVNSTSLTLRDGTPLKLSGEVGPNPCIYLQNGAFFTRPCHRMHNFICKRMVEVGWL